MDASAAAKTIYAQYQTFRRSSTLFESFLYSQREAMSVTPNVAIESVRSFMILCRGEGDKMGYCSFSTTTSASPTRVDRSTEKREPGGYSTSNSLPACFDSFEMSLPCLPMASMEIAMLPSRCATAPPREALNIPSFTNVLPGAYRAAASAIG